MVIEELQEDGESLPRAPRYPTSRSWRSAYDRRLFPPSLRHWALISALERDGDRR